MTTFRQADSGGACRLDFDEAAGKLQGGCWLVYPYEAYGNLDRDEWNFEAVKYFAERGIRADVISIPKKSVAVFFNVDWAPAFEEVRDSIAAVDYWRSMGLNATHPGTTSFRWLAS